MSDAANDPVLDSAQADPALEEVTTPDGRTVVVLRDRAIHLTSAGTMNEDDAARYLGCSARTMQRMRRERRGPRYHNLSGRYWYTLAALDEYLQLCAVDPLAG